MNPIWTTILIICSLSLSAASRAEKLTMTVTDVTHEYALKPAPTPTDDLDPTTAPSSDADTDIDADTDPTPAPGNGGGLGGLLGKVDIDQIITIGEKIWKYLLDNKPSATYQTVKASVVPQGITNWTQLSGWSKPVSRVYRVEFTNIFGKPAASFDYRISYVYGGSYKSKGRYIGQISFAPEKIKLKTGRSLDVKAEVINNFNFGTESNPIAAAQLQVQWTTPTLNRYQMNSAEYFIYGTGEIQDITGGTVK